jgi:dihydrofolate synthase/folylpolyglutamate synthase
MARIIADRFGDVIVSTPGFFKKSDPRQVFTLVADHNDNTVFKPDPREALQTALELSCGSRPILVTGSFYMIAEIKRLYVEKKAKIG